MLQVPRCHLHWSSFPIFKWSASPYFYLIWCSYIFTMLHWLQRNSVIDKTQATAGSTSAQKVQSQNSMKWCKIMSLVTKKTQLCATKGTSVIMLEIPQRKKKKLKAGGVMATVTNNLKHLLYRRANILNMYNYTKVVNWCVILTEKIMWRMNFPISWAL